MAEDPQNTLLQAAEKELLAKLTAQVEAVAVEAVDAFFENPDLTVRATFILSFHFAFNRPRPPSFLLFQILNDAEVADAKVLLEKQLDSVSTVVVKLAETTAETAGANAWDTTASDALNAAKAEVDTAVAASQLTASTTVEKAEGILGKIEAIATVAKEVDGFVAQTYSDLLGEAYTQVVQDAVAVQSTAQVGARSSFFFSSHTRIYLLQACIFCFLFLRPRLLRRAWTFRETSKTRICRPPKQPHLRLSKKHSPPLSKRLSMLSLTPKPSRFAATSKSFFVSPSWFFTPPAPF